MNILPLSTLASLPVSSQIHYTHTHFHTYHIVFTSALSRLLSELALAGASVMAQQEKNLPAVQETQEM